jgi:hypothetical protein
MWGVGLEVVPDYSKDQALQEIVDEDQALLCLSSIHQSSWLRAASYTVVFAVPDFCRLNLTCFLDRRVIYMEPGVGASQLGKLKQNRPGVVFFNESWDIPTMQLD